MDKANELNIEAIVEGLLYVVGDEGLKLEQFASVIERSNEDCEAILLNIRNKYASDLLVSNWFLTETAINSLPNRRSINTLPSCLTRSTGSISPKVRWRLWRSSPTSSRSPASRSRRSEV